MVVSARQPHTSTVVVSAVPEPVVSAVPEPVVPDACAKNEPVVGALPP